MNKTIRIKHKFLCKNPDCPVHSIEYDLHDENSKYSDKCSHCNEKMEAIY